MDYGSVQAEKAKAMTRYRRLRNLAKMWRLLEVLVALAFLSWSSTRLPVTVKLAGQGVLQLFSYLFNRHINFVLANAIIIFLFLQFRRNNARNNAGTGDLYDQYVHYSEAHQDIASVSDFETPTAPRPPAPEMEETVYDDKHIVLAENAVTQMQCEAVSTAIEQASKQIRRFQRTQSEKLKHDLRTKPPRQLGRSETEIKPRAVAVATSGYRRSFSSFDKVDTLSSEEFRRMIDDVIANRKRSLWAQKMAEKNQ